ncbi:TraR/DksA family transcriptional regulator [Hydrogenothermus marinus]|uniref:TraR/DksA family transcriptional regulator n=1 Tax=Hydrogenothermus marinus TaxID=133270 RepID=A0A3M0BKV0_9AQUI|nr:TraR/DksA family transcriptional regulator [Hydrogenothermus marinus]RMA96979.1 TraR/DksA family transcriptional regulator [Hydrogenothermus marinus]
MDKEKLQYFRNLLLEKKKGILSRYLENEEIIRKMKEEELTIPEQLEDYANFNISEILLGEMEDVEIKIIREIDKALERINDGTYGYCEVCGKPIEEKRLEAIPWTTLCIEHAKEAEKYQLTPDSVYKDYLEESLIPYDEELDKEIKEEGFDK